MTTTAYTPNLTVSIAGPHEGETGKTYPFTATVSLSPTDTISSSFTAIVSPSLPLSPITYTWKIDDNDPIVHSSTALTDSLHMEWDTVGKYTVMVSVTNGQQIVSATHAITIVQGMTTSYLPLIQKPIPTIYGFETSPGSITRTNLLERAKGLDAHWIRLKTVHWRDVQPTEDGEYDWSALAKFEGELAAAQAADLTPIVILHKHPDWAIIPETDAMCAAIDTQYFDDYARFLSALVERYSQRPYNVHHWELGNEPDVDPVLLSKLFQEHFGCWGDIDDPFYGGRHYGEMLKVVAPAMRKQDPRATIIIGGLTLDKPNTQAPDKGKPELFLKGILEAGAGASFDVVAFHTYPWYISPDVDSDRSDVYWADYGGLTLGKIAYINELLRTYEVKKSLYMNEGALIYPTDPKYPSLRDDEIPAEFLQAQADHIVRQLTRALSAGVEVYSWYTLHRSGWFASGLLNGDLTPRPVYTAYAFYIETIGYTRPVPTDAYGSGVYAYRFDQRYHRVDVVWSKTAEEQIIRVPTNDLRTVYHRDGSILEPIDRRTMQDVGVGLSPVYIVRTLDSP